MQRRRIFASLALWSEKRRARSEATAAVLQGNEASDPTTLRKEESDILPDGIAARMSRTRDAA